MSHPLVERLEHKLRLRIDFADKLNGLGLWLLDHCAFAAYVDCVEAGLGKEADAVVSKLKLQGVAR